MWIHYEEGDEVIHIKNKTFHTVYHAYVGPGEQGNEQMISVSENGRYIRSRNYAPVKIKIGKYTLHTTSFVLSIMPHDRKKRNI